MNEALHSSREKPHRFAQFYGYAVCLTAVIVGLISANNAVNAAFDLSDPAHAQRWGGSRDIPPTFEEYRAEKRGQLRPDPSRPLDPSGGTAARSELTDDELRRIYDANRADMLRGARFRAKRSLAASMLLLVVSIGLFAWHWRWIRSLREDDRAVTPRQAP